MESNGWTVRDMDNKKSPGLIPDFFEPVPFLLQPAGLLTNLIEHQCSCTPPRLMLKTGCAEPDGAADWAPGLTAALAAAGISPDHS